jgi:hypothetical protein
MNSARRCCYGVLESGSRLLMVLRVVTTKRHPDFSAAFL